MEPIEIQKAELENLKLNEEIKQLQAPYLKKNLTVIISALSIVATVVLGFESLHTKEIKDQQQIAKEFEEKNKVLSAEQEKIQVSFLENKKLLIDAQNEKNEFIRARLEKDIGDFNKEKLRLEATLQDGRDSIEVLASEVEKVTTTNIQLRKDRDSEKANIQTLLLDKNKIADTIKLKYVQLENLNKKIERTQATQNLLNALNKDLNDRIINLYLSWTNKRPAKNKRLKDNFIAFKKDIRDKYNLTGLTVTDLYNDFDRSIDLLIDEIEQGKGPINQIVEKGNALRAQAERVANSI